MKEANKLARAKIDIDEKNYMASEVEARKIPEMAQQLNKDEETVRLRVDKFGEITKTKDEIKQIVLEQTRLEGQKELKFAE